MSSKKPERGVLAYGDEIIHYEVDRLSANNSNQKVLIKVHPDSRVVATAPQTATSKTIQQAMLKQVRWIWQCLSEFAAQQQFIIEREYLSGEAQFYLGKRYVLKVTVDANLATGVKMLRGKLNVTLGHDKQQLSKERQSTLVKANIDKWYIRRANVIFAQRLKALLPKTPWVNEMPTFRVMAMKKQWGSCSAKGNLLLNPHLVKAPRDCIDYVILHELCHIAEHNHSDKFWRLVGQTMPNWQAVKNQLDEMAELYLSE